MRCAPQVAHHVTITQPEIYEYVQNNMWHLPLDELKSELEVSKRIARALRDGVPINLSYDRLMVLESNIAFIRRFCLKSRIRCVIEDSRYGELYVKLNRYLAKVIAEMSQDIAKITRGGWTTRHVNFLRAISPWRDQLVAIQLLAELKKWYAMVHERYPEFDSVLFEGTGLFKDNPAVRTENESNDQAAIPAQRPRRKPSSSRKSYVAMQKGAWDMAKFLLKQFPPRPSSISKHK